MGIRRIRRRKTGSGDGLHGPVFEWGIGGDLDVDPERVRFAQNDGWGELEVI
jgi:hypothetical protein